MSERPLVMPRLGQTMEFGTIAEWLTEDGAAVLELSLEKEGVWARVRAGKKLGRASFAFLHDAALKMLDVDPVGFDLMDRKLLEAILHKFGGGPVGVDNLAAAIGEERDTIEDVLEPYLIQQGFLQRTPRGRVATLLTYRHFGLAAPDASSPISGLWDAAAT